MAPSKTGRARRENPRRAQKSQSQLVDFDEFDGGRSEIDDRIAIRFRNVEAEEIHALRCGPVEFRFVVTGGGGDASTRDELGIIQIQHQTSAAGPVLDEIDEGDFVFVAIFNLRIAGAMCSS